MIIMIIIHNVMVVNNTQAKKISYTHHNPNFLSLGNMLRILTEQSWVKS